MVVDRPALLDFARVAQECFFRQDWPLKELVVFNTTGKPLNLWPHRSVHEIRLRRLPRPLMLRILRENADGQWCVTWDADCWYDPSVISRHICEAQNDTALLFRHTTAYSVFDRKAYVISDDRIVHGSFLRSAQLDFEQPFYRQLPRLKMLDAPAHCVVKFVNRITHEA
jgi:hypothetical protein